MNEPNRAELLEALAAAAADLIAEPGVHPPFIGDPLRCVVCGPKVHRFLDVLSCLTAIRPLAAGDPSRAKHQPRSATNLPEPTDGEDKPSAPKCVDCTMPCHCEGPQKLTAADAHCGLPYHACRHA